MDDQYLMVLDAGTGAGRCLLISLDGQESFTAYKEWEYIIPPRTGPMGRDFDPEVFWNILAKTACEVIQRAGIRAEQIVAISSTSQREGMVLLDSSGKEIYAGPNRDFRAAMEGMQVASSYGAELYRRSGHYPNGIFAPARLLWHKKNAPEIYQKADCLLMINDWILYRLSGEKACEPTNAAETCLYDLTTVNWTFDIIKALQLPEELFPGILPSGAIIGDVTASAAKATGLLPGTPVIVGGADTQCGLLGSGGCQDEDIAAISGTSTPIQMVIDRPLIDPSERLWTAPHCIPGKFVLESNAGATGSIYQWLRDTFCQIEIEQAVGQGRSAYELMNQEAEKAPPGAGGAQSFLGVGIFNAKTLEMPPSLISMGMAPLSMPGKQSRQMFIRAVLESLAYCIKANADQIFDLYGRRSNRFLVCGGLAQSQLYLEILANLIEMPVHVPRWKEGTAVGAAICAGVGAGVYSGFEEGVHALAKVDRVVEPDPKLIRQYKNFYHKWLKNREAFAALNH